MNRAKIGYSDIGGIYIGANVASALHKHNFVVLIFAASKSFDMYLESSKTAASYEAVLIRKNVLYRIVTERDEYAIFVHFDPYSEIGLLLNQMPEETRRLERTKFSLPLGMLRAWFEGRENAIGQVEKIMEGFISVVAPDCDDTRKLDDRILRCIEYCGKQDEEGLSLRKAARELSLSPSRLSHLFKAETGSAFREFLQNRKLVRSLKSMYKNDSLTEAAFFGGFSDQAHFSNTFKRAFGIRPSSSKNSR